MTGRWHRGDLVSVICVRRGHPSLHGFRWHAFLGLLTYQFWGPVTPFGAPCKAWRGEPLLTGKWREGRVIRVFDDGTLHIRFTGTGRRIRALPGATT